MKMKRLRERKGESDRGNREGEINQPVIIY